MTSAQQRPVGKKDKLLSVLRLLSLWSCCSLFRGTMYNFPTNHDHSSFLIVSFLISLQCNSMLLMFCPLHNSFIYSQVNVTVRILRAAVIPLLFRQPAPAGSHHPRRAPAGASGEHRHSGHPWTCLARAAGPRSAGSCSCAGTHRVPRAAAPAGR